MLRLIILIGIVLAHEVSNDYSEPSSLNLKLHDTFTIKLLEFQSAGYTWEIRTPLENDESIIKFVDKTYFDKDNKDNKIGQPVIVTFQFNSINKGTMDLEFVHRRPWIKKDDPNDTRKIINISVD
ncbi:MAG: hypothetical protein EZS28_037594 [Streblomastix strix]|uniref:Proteinase inhibitor I42 chagasin domain-containing protein n=1 Tax=Streblomastix strix TaxID=222440 RepID=A0A5J4U942_9EUKA|nr:MAG: hypothetical protein EZS28_037594 [Streblomastix strix]